VLPKGRTRDPNMLRAQYLENSWRSYLATISNYNIVGCEAVRSYDLSDSLASCHLTNSPTPNILYVSCRSSLLGILMVLVHRPDFLKKYFQYFYRKH